MEQLMKRQFELMHNIERVYINFKKDGSERRTYSNVNRKLDMLSAYWNEFNSINGQLIDYQDLGHEYFQQNWYASTKHFYNTVYNYFQQYLRHTEDPKSHSKPSAPQVERLSSLPGFPKTEDVERPSVSSPYVIPQLDTGATNPAATLPPASLAPPAPAQPASLAPRASPAPRTPAQPAPGGSAPQHNITPRAQQPRQSEIKHAGTSSKLDENLRRQRSNFKAFSRTVTNINYDSLSEKWEFEDVIKLIDSRWKAIDSLHWEIDSELYEENVEYERLFTTYEMEYNEVKKHLNQKMWSESYRTKITPTMELPIFTGDYQKWVSFKDLFEETIHKNRSMSNAQKMQFLKGKVKGEAEKLIQHLNISSDNYQVCWDILTHRYNNPKLIFSSHINILMALPIMQQQASAQIKKIHDTAKECLNAIKNLGVDVSTWDPLIVHILSQKLDADTHKEYHESIKSPRELPSLSEFFDFLENKFTSLEASKRKQDSNNQRAISYNNTQASNIKKSAQQHNYNNFNKQFSNNRYNSYSAQPIAKSYHVSSQYKCLFCKGAHSIFYCNEYTKLPIDKKLKVTSDLRLCTNCLYDHKGEQCRSTKTCRKCPGLHNTLLHDAFSQPRPSTSSAYTSSRDNVNVSQNDSSEILLATAQIKVQAADGSHHYLRALIDQGSQISLITEKAAQQLGLPRRRCKGVVYGLGTQENNCKGAMNIKISAIHGDYTFNTNVVIMKNLINNLPNQTFTKPVWSHIENISLADPQFYVSRPVDILLGADIYALIMMGGVIKGEDKTLPIAQQTHLGWLLCGNVTRTTYQCNVVLNNIGDLQRFWAIEDIAENTMNMSTSDYHCVEQYKQHTYRQADGRYVVRLPMKPDTQEKLGESKQRAAAQFLQLEKKFIKNQNISHGYRMFINEYIKLGHMYVADGYGNTSLACYLPHHCVLRADSATTALRVVFNASSPTTSGYSLNDLMHSGPNLQQDILSLILKWRQYEIAFTADIEKMFRQILVHPEDQNLQKIIWRDSTQQALQAYNLATVTYGTKAAPFLAMMTLKQLANDEGHKYTSEAKRALEEDFYMDDLLSGSHSVPAAKQLQADLINLLKSGGFHLRKWASNKPELLQGVETALNQQAFEFKYPESTKTLGLKWNPVDDLFSFQLKLKSESAKTLTKRVLLSEISKIFDPLGWLVPVTTKLKLLFQRVWVNDIDWDSKLPADIISEWQNIQEELEGINQIRVKRWLETKADTSIELHGFCDASTKAYACVIYCRVTSQDPDGKHPSSAIIVAAKARLVPLKRTITLPRLELMGCLLLSKLMEKVIKSLPNHTIRTFGWTDSTAVLGWLQGDTGRWKPFVANRVEQVTAILPSTCWRYVKSAENPADCASRGITAKQLTEHPLWWSGPSWLTTYNTRNEREQPVYTTDQELRKKVQTNVATINQNDVISDIVNKHSCFVRATRVLAWVTRAVSRNRPKQSYLSSYELSEARLKIISHYQKTEFAAEIQNLEHQEKISSKSKILSLTPFLDKNGLLRVGGRIKHAHITDNMKHPLIIPHDGHLTNLLIDQAHKSTYHGGTRLTLNHIRQNYWIIGGNRAVKKRLRNCVTCRRHDPVKQTQLMGDLPAARCNPTRPFFHTGVDYTGYVEVKANKGRGIKTTKGYIAVFICMVTKAVHLELVSDLSASAFLAALRRMSARRGAPRHLYCDNGTNFVGSNRIITQEFINLQATLDDEFFTQVSDMKIEFHFNAPSWPSAGGLWEAAVKSLKHHLRRVLGEQKLTFEEFSTLLSQLEACLNSRPLCPLSEDPEDIDVLTPAHFLSSGPTLTIVETERDERTRWQLTQKIFNDIWRRWQSEYLCQLTTRSKWQQPQNNQKIGDIVIIQDANLPPGKWPLGRVVELHPGKDGHVRVVSVKTKNGIIQRPITKLSPLPVNNAAQQQDQQSQQQYQQSKQQDQQSAPTNTKPKLGSSFKTLAITLLTMMLVLPTQCAYNIAQLRNNQSIYFDKISDMHLSRDEWKLIVYYDMKPYWEGSNMLNKYIDSLDTLCSKQKPSLCDAILLQLRHGYNELDHYNHLLLDQQNAGVHARARRGLINGIGNLASTLFGVLDNQFAEQYERDIELLRQNQRHITSLWKNQTSIVEAEHNLLQRVEATMDRQNKVINQHINALEKMANSMKNEIESITKSNDFALSAIISNNILQNLKNVQEYLLDTIVDLHYGSFNIHLITPEQLRDELNIISGQLSKDLSLPINNIHSDLSKLYHILTVKAKMTKQFFIFEIRIPLVARDYYEIYRLIPIQHEAQNKMVSIIPISHYVAMNVQKDSYLTLTQADLQKCSQYDDITHLCPLRSPVHHITSDKSLCVWEDTTTQCATYPQTCKTTWTQLNKINTHLFSCCGHCTIRIICGSQVSAEQLSRSGIISLNEGCIIKSESFTIYSHRQQTNALNIEADVLKIEIPSINHIIDLPLRSINDTYPDEDDYRNHTVLHYELKRIGNQIQKLKEAETEVMPADRASPHDITQNVLIYIIIGIIICASGTVVWRRLYLRKHINATVTPTPIAHAQTCMKPRDPPPAPPKLQARAIDAHAPADGPSAKSETRQQTANIRISDDSDIELADVRYARLVHKATSPSFRNQFSN